MNGLIIAAQVEGVQTRKDRTLKITLGSQELSPAQGAEILGLSNRVVAVYISSKETIPQSDIDQVDAVDPEFESKTQSQRIRGVLYKLFEQDKEGHKTFDNYYQARTEKIIEHLKKQIK